MMNKDHVWKKNTSALQPGAVEVERAGLGIWGGSNSQKHIPQRKATDNLCCFTVFLEAKKMKVSSDKVE